MAIGLSLSLSFLILLLFLCLWPAEAEYIAYNTSQGIVPGKLNVHIVAHTHDDVGWLKTVDQYYVGANNSIQGACVQNVLDSMVTALLADKNRRFIYVEQRWWRQQSNAIKNIVKGLVESGQLEFINGGMCMHDEATTHYVDMIDQTTLGHRFIKEEFNKIPRIGWQIDPFGHSAVQAYLLSRESNAIKNIVNGLVESGQLEFINGGMCMHDEATHYVDMIDQTTLGHRFIKEEFNKIPRIGWQIDPFGHSAVQAYLLSREVGFDALYFFRIDYQDNKNRKDLKSLEVIWRGSKSFGSSADIFTGIFPKNYEPPPGDFYFEVNDASPIVQDDPLLFDYNVQERVNDFVAAAVSQANITRMNHIMFTMGTDFKYQYANSWFRQLDKFIHYVNMDGRVNALYSTPSIYTDAKYAANESWPLKVDDFFTYADDPNAYWTGYFTSRPALKGYVRMMSAYYMVARQLEFIKGRNASGPTSDSLADALAVAQHHDAVSGTEKQHVANDYAKRLSIGYAVAEKLVDSSLACLTESGSVTGCSKSATKFEQCPLLNISYCPPSEVKLSQQKNLVVLVYNSLGWERVDIIRIPVVSKTVVVRDAEGREIESQLLPLADATASIRNHYVKAFLGISPTVTPKYWLAFQVSVPPLGFSTYIVSKTKQTGSASFMSTQYSSQGSNTVEVGSGHLKLFYDSSEGKLSYYSNSRSLVKTTVEQSYKYYSGYNGTTDDPQASGAYIFRPNGTFSIKSEKKVPFTILQGPILQEVHHQISPWIYQITRVYKAKEHVEFEFMVGPIPIDDGVGKEISTQIVTAMMTNKTFYTDSNGRDFIKRIRDYRSDWELHVNQPIAGNYYPINLGIYTRDNSAELSVLVDRSMGGSSIKDGQLELMLHRRLLNDDGRGVGEALNETVCVNDECAGLTVQGRYYLKIDPLGEGAKWRRSFGQEIYSPLLLAFSEQDGGNWTNSHIRSFSAIEPSYSLPDNVALITLQALEDGTVLLRLAHLYEVGEDRDLSAMTYVDLKKLFPNKKIGKITETSLSANQERAAMEKKRLNWKHEGSPSLETILKGGPIDPFKLVLELGPMEIRTFLLNFEDLSLK